MKFAKKYYLKMFSWKYKTAPIIFGIKTPYNKLYSKLTYTGAAKLLFI